MSEYEGKEYKGKSILTRLEKLEQKVKELEAQLVRHKRFMLEMAKLQTKGVVL